MRSHLMTMDSFIGILIIGGFALLVIAGIMVLHSALSPKHRERVRLAKLQRQHHHRRY